jgi:hypothetical protein
MPDHQLGGLARTGASLDDVLVTQVSSIAD